MDTDAMVYLATSGRESVEKIINDHVRKVVLFTGFHGRGDTAHMGLGLILCGDQNPHFFVSSQSLRDSVRLYQAMKFLQLGAARRVTPMSLELCIRVVHLDALEDLPAHELSDICAYLGLSSPAELRLFWIEARKCLPPHKSFVRWRKALTKAGIPVVVAVEPQPLKRPADHSGHPPRVMRMAAA